MSKHHLLTAQCNMSVYFCDASSPWQKGTNENTNGLLRQYLPKGKNLGLYSQEQLDKIALQLNTRPRKILGFKTPLEVFQTGVEPPRVARRPNFLREYPNEKYLLT